MTKSDLKELMLVEIRDGYKYILTNGKFRCAWGCIELNGFNEDLTHKFGAKNEDIVKVYSALDFLSYDTTGRELLWERKEEKPLTNKQIMQKAISTYGKEAQMDMAVDKMTKLSTELLKCRVKSFYRTWDCEKVKSNISAEIADAEIMLAQCKIMFQCKKEVKEWKEKKIARLAERLKGKKCGQALDWS